MLFLVDMKLSEPGRGLFTTSWSEAITFISDFAIPTVLMLDDLRAQGKIIAGGPRAGDIWITVIAEASSPLEIDKLFEVLPLWPRLMTTVTPLTTFGDRVTSLKHKLAYIKGRIDAGFPTPLE